VTNEQAAEATVSAVCGEWHLDLQYCLMRILFFWEGVEEEERSSNGEFIFVPGTPLLISFSC
jgi:hypothetical protein